jgi:hypothetical protein
VLLWNAGKDIILTAPVLKIQIIFCTVGKECLLMFEYKNIQWERKDLTAFACNLLTHTSQTYHLLRYVGKDKDGNLYLKDHIGSKED